MATNSISLLGSDIDASVLESVGSLVSVDTLNGRYRVSLPIVMPSGGLVDVSIYREPGSTFMVSDDGTAFFEVAGYGVSKRSFTAVARERADRVGATFDGEALLFIRVGPEQLRAAIISIGNLSAEVASAVVERSVRSNAESARDQLFGRVEDAFRGKPITHDVEIYGASTATYQFDAMVELADHRVAFDLFTKEPVSIAATYTKLSDVSRAEGNPTLVGVTRNPDIVGPKLALISSVAKVIRLDAATETFQRAAA